MPSISDKTKRYLSFLEQKYDFGRYSELISDLLNLSADNIINGPHDSVELNQYKDYIEWSSLYAKYKDSQSRYIGVNIVKLKDTKNPANARAMQRNFIASLMDRYNLDASISAIYSDNDGSWRLSFVKQELAFNNGKISSQYTPVKRYSYLVGENEPNHTAKEQLMPLLENDEKQYTVEEIEERFSVEKVTKQFFETYKENYLKLYDDLEKNEEFLSEAHNCGFTTEQFAKKLMGQIVFIYFLQKKGWLGVKLVPSSLSNEEYNDLYNRAGILEKKLLDKYYVTFNGEKKIKKDLLEKYKENEQEIASLSDIFLKTKYNGAWGSGNKKFIRHIFTNCINRKKNFFDDFLEPFFYNGLNNKRQNQYFGLFNCKIPFLNGGLFEPLDNYKWELARFNIDNSIFSNENNDGILDFFDIYNFTMNEEEPLEKEVAVDPEMLGKIFENLLEVKDRKSKGAFYTPREIVSFMCQESLANYIVDKVGTDYKETKELIQYGDIIRDLDINEATDDKHLIGNSIFNNILNIDKALSNVKIADPAVGSGAFPLGILNEIVKIRDILTSYMLIYNRLGKFDKMFPEERIRFNRSIYKLKWDTIKNCIYAVDVENSAVDITKLRLWLSVVVDQIEVPDSGPEPLPNLDCKIMQGNSLVDEYEGIKLIKDDFIEEAKKGIDYTYIDKKQYGQLRLFDSDKYGTQIELYADQKLVLINQLVKCKMELYGANDSQKKNELLEEIDNYRKELFKVNYLASKKSTINELMAIDNSHEKPYFSWKLEFIEVFVENNGFDIVIGNPPYLESRNPDFDPEFKELLQSIIKARYGKKAYYFPKGTDLLIYFFELSNRLLCNKGINTFITENAWLDTEYGSKFQEFLLENLNVLGVIDSDYKYFETADINTVITILKKDSIVTSPISYYKVHSKSFNNCNILSDIQDNSITKKSFELNNRLLKEFKWGFLFNSSDILLEVLNKMNEKGKTAENGNCSIGQGLNLTKDYFIKDDIACKISKEALIPIYTVDNNGALVWTKPITFIVNRELNHNHIKNVKEYDFNKTTKVPPHIIMPRGVGNRHYASINKVNGYSASYVDIYLNDVDEEKLLNVWLFCNSSLFWLLRESMGRTNLGGGMLKAEAIDLKNIPILFEFQKKELIKGIQEELPDSYVVDDSTIEIQKEYHKQIDSIVFDYLDIDNATREELIKELVYKIKSRYKENI